MKISLLTLLLPSEYSSSFLTRLSYEIFCIQCTNFVDLRFTFFINVTSLVSLENVIDVEYCRHGRIWVSKNAESLVSVS